MVNRPTNKNKPANWTKNRLYSIFVYFPTAFFQTTGCAPALRMFPKLWILKAWARFETDWYVGVTHSPSPRRISRTQWCTAWLCYPWLQVCQVCLLTAIDFASALLPCKLVHTRCTRRNRCGTQNLERWTLSWDWKATPRSHRMHPAARSLHGRCMECSSLVHLASCLLCGGMNTALGCVPHCLLSRSTLHIIAIHCLMLRPYLWAPDTYLSSGFLIGKDESPDPKTTVSLKHAQTEFFCVGGWLAFAKACDSFPHFMSRAHSTGYQWFRLIESFQDR